MYCQHSNCRPAWHRFQPQGGKEYTVHSIQYTLQTFSWLLLSFVAESSASGPQSGKAPYHSLPLPHLFYLYISGGGKLWTLSESTKKNFAYSASQDSCTRHNLRVWGVTLHALSYILNAPLLISKYIWGTPNSGQRGV
jgi:hypothetical protein